MKSLIFFLSAFLILAFWGCSDRATTPGPTDDLTLIQQEIPPDVQKMVDEYIGKDVSLTSDEYLDYLDPPPDDMVSNCDIYSVTFLWGNLFNAGTPSADTTDWTGTLWMNAEGIIHVRHEIDFEPGQDSVLPHNAPVFAAWISKTCQDIDGLSFLVFIRRDVDYFVPPVLTFETEPFTVEFDFYQLIMLDAFYQVDDQNGVVVHARKIWHNHCPGGIIEGVWEKEAFGSGQGTFHGMWKDRLGQPFGYMNGFFWTNEDGQGVFQGEVSGIVTDQVIAMLHGIWYYDDPRLCPMCGEGHGIFRGHFIFLDRPGNGVLKGEFGDVSLPPDQLDLPLTGIWEVNCPFASLTSDWIIE